MRLRTSILLALALALAGWAGGWLASDLWRRSSFGRAERGSVQVKEVAKTPLEAAKPASTGGPVATRDEKIISLPPLDTPVKDVIAQLKGAADAGNVQASCRIAMDLMRCREARHSKAIVESLRRNLRTLKPGSNAFMSMRDMIEIQEKQRIREAAACEGVGDAAMDAAWKYLLRAAQAGHVESMSLFLVAPPLPQTAIEDIEGYTAYRDFAPFFFESAIRAGDTRAALSAYQQYAWGEGTGGGKVFERDPQKALTYAHLLLPLLDMSTADVVRVNMRIFEGEPGVDAVQAIRDAEKMRRESFARSAPINVENSRTPLPASCNAAD